MSAVLARPRALSFVSPRSYPRLRLRHPAYSTFLAVAPRRSQHFESGFTTTYDPSQDTGRGPIFKASSFGVPQFYPRDLKENVVDQYVIGQDRAKRTICSVIFNHYQSLRRRHHFEVQEAQAEALRARVALGGSIEDEFPVHRVSTRGTQQLPEDTVATLSADPAENFYVPEDPAAPRPVKIDKSNLLLIGPTGVGKTYILETLSKKLNVPFTISDCNAFTQAGYIGQDVEACLERLLIEANYDVKAAEHGIVVLDEFDKLARKDTVNGRDVGGEGVQQALLKLVEGTKVTLHIKDHRPSRSSTTAGSYGGSNPSSSPPSGKPDQYIIDTTNILFVFCGAFVGLDKAVLRRVAKPSIGFGSEIRAGRNSSLSGGKDFLPPEMYSHLPHQPVFPLTSASATGTPRHNFTPLDLTTPQDLQTFGFIPELIGRLHNICALTPLSLDEMFRILTEPRNSLVAQYTALFETYPSRLFFTRRALYAIAERAAKNETGARGLKMEMERVLAEPMFDAPTPYVLITEGCVNGTEKAGYWGKDGRLEVERRIQDEEERGVPGEETYEQYREAGEGSA